MVTARGRNILVAIMMLVVTVATALSLILLYRTSLQSQQQWLIRNAQGNAAMIRAMAEFDAKLGEEALPEGVSAATLRQMEAAHEVHGAYGRTGEWVIGRRDGERVRFLLPLRHRPAAAEFPMGGGLAEPMQRALGGGSGLVFGRDYRGVDVMAAYAPVPQLNMGVVAKIDMAEVRAPFIRVALVVTVLALLLSLAGAVMFRRLTGRFVARLQRSEARLAEAQRIAQIGSWELDLVSNELVWSDEIFRIFEIDQRRFPATYEAFVAAIHPDDRAMVNQAYQQSLEQHRPYDIVHRLQFDGGAVKYVRERCETFYDERDRPLRSVGTVQDVTQLHLAEQRLRQARDELEERVVQRTAELERARDEAQRASRLKSEFLARVSHELHTPLHAVIGFGQLLQDEPLSAEQQDMVSEITRASHRFLGLIDRLLYVSEVESDSIRLDLEDVEAQSVIEQCLEVARIQARHRGIRVTDNLRDDCDVILRVDAMRFKEVLLHLLGNAIDYNRDNGRVDVQCLPQAQTRIRITVRDTGPGVPRDRLAMLFEPFQRLGMEYTNIEGAGFGLAIAKRLTGLMGGEIGVDSREGEGALFWVEFPCTHAGAAQSGSAGTPQQ